MEQPALSLRPTVSPSGLGTGLPQPRCVSLGPTHPRKVPWALLTLGRTSAPASCQGAVPRCHSHGGIHGSPWEGSKPLQTGPTEAQRGKAVCPKSHREQGGV